MNNEIIGQRIGTLREQRGISRADFADAMAVSAQAVGKWERGESLPDVLTMKKIADFFNVKIDYFFDCETQGALMQEYEGAQEDSADEAGQDKGAEAGAKTKTKRQFWDMSAAIWKDADFSNLSNIADKFKSSHILNCKFCDSDLSGITFRGNNIKNCNFTGADLSESKFSMSNMPHNDFSSCNFKNTAIKMCSTQKSNFSFCDFTGAEINGTALNQNDFSGAVFSDTKFKNAVLNKLSIRNDITDCSFVNCLFINSEFNGATLRNTFFKSVRIKSTKFINCRADNITYSFLKNCKADMSGIELLNE